MTMDANRGDANISVALTDAALPYSPTAVSNRENF
jgi:hypothetical protein